MEGEESKLPAVRSIAWLGARVESLMARIKENDSDEIQETEAVDRKHERPTHVVLAVACSVRVSNQSPDADASQQLEDPADDHRPSRHATSPCGHQINSRNQQRSEIHERADYEVHAESAPNENKLSHRWRERALLRNLMLKSCES